MEMKFLRAIIKDRGNYRIRNTNLRLEEGVNEKKNTFEKQIKMAWT